MDLCFTVVLDAGRGYQSTFQLRYAPDPCWLRDGETILNLGDLGHRYEFGSFQRLLAKAPLEASHDGKKRRAVLVYDRHFDRNGFDDATVLGRIREDIEAAGFDVVLVDV